MSERLLGWGLRLLGLFLAIGPFLIALGMHNWNIQAAVLPSGAEMSQAQDMLSEIFGGEGLSLENMLTGTPTFTSNSVTIGFTSPFKIPAKIKQLAASVTDQGVQLGQVQLQGEKELPPGATTNITLVGTLTAIPENLQFENVNIEFEVYGVTVQMQPTQAQGGS